MFRRTLLFIGILTLCSGIIQIAAGAAFAADAELGEAAKLGVVPADDASLFAGAFDLSGEDVQSLFEIPAFAALKGFAVKEFTTEEGTYNSLLIVPRYAATVVKVYGLTYVEQGGEGYELLESKEPVYTGELGAKDLFVLHLNMPETIPYFKLCLESGGQKACFIPGYSGMDGSLLLEPGFMDLTPAE